MKINITENEGNQRLDKFCRKYFKDVPLSAIYKSIRMGNIKVNEKKSKEKYMLQIGDVVDVENIEFNHQVKKFNKIEKMKLKITYEDENMLLVEKWPGVLVHGDKAVGEVTLTDHVLSYLEDKGFYYKEEELTFRPTSCNRLDKNTSGIVIFGKNFAATKSLNEMLRNRDIDKYYLALVKGRVKDGIYEAYITKNPKTNESKVSLKEEANSKKIAMEVKSLESVGIYSYIEIKLLTGRSHQIRAHLSFLGNPIIGDPKYGVKKENDYFYNKYGLNYQFLYAYKLTFKSCSDNLSYLENKTIAESLPPIFKKIKKDVMRF
ncbi:23S rRNA pseudouridine955/2504/2580 synthase [Hathewaya proteolytica DSM 3090]|uniref:Pseudouridine synthase n=1 Tax=Hathewaya proteolytica DSM 3090 TaxID=1121331 RepID=A0A1M6LG79_9CLOT|nr:RluA family pseudouridine synthase [Hathewaya proteolytica]SHJ70197.1 23S rRNA pseudouridine955/2504/2580 synthase [Hathewaya proteolytica DSM 3090]